MKLRTDMLKLLEEAPLAVRLAYAAGWLEGTSIGDEAKRLIIAALVDAAHAACAVQP